MRTFCPHLGRLFFCVCCFFFHYVSVKFHLWPSSGDLPRPWIGMLSLVTVSPVITAFHSCCLSHHVNSQIKKPHLKMIPIKDNFKCPCSIIFKQIYLVNKWNPNRYFHFGYPSSDIASEVPGLGRTACHTYRMEYQ